MASVLDVADYILKQQGRLPAMKLQKLVYYAEAWSLVWDDKHLFNARIEAWANGPVIPALYRHHRGQYEVDRKHVNGNYHQLTDTERATIDAVLKYYGSKNSQWLSDLTHAEQPWRKARGSLKPGERGNTEIKRDAIAEYYGSL